MQTTAPARGRSASLFLAGVVAGLTLGALSAHAINIDSRGEVRLGLRSYVAARVGTNTIGSENNPLNWPRSGAGHLRQNRFFVQLSYDHDLTRMVKESWGLLAPFRLLDPSTLKYTLEYRFEGEGLYNWGPTEYSNPYATTARFQGDFPTVKLDIPGVAKINTTPNLDPRFIKERTDRLLRNARVRNRLFLAYVDFEKGPLVPARRPSEPGVGRDRRLPAARQHQPARRQLRRLLHRARRTPRADRRWPAAAGSSARRGRSRTRSSRASSRRATGSPPIRASRPARRGRRAASATPNPVHPPDHRHARTRPGPRRRAARLHRRGRHLQRSPTTTRTSTSRARSSASPAQVRRLEHVPTPSFEPHPGLPAVPARARSPAARPPSRSPALLRIVRSEVAYFRGEPMSRQGNGDSFDAFGLGDRRRHARHQAAAVVQQHRGRR